MKSLPLRYQLKAIRIGDRPVALPPDGNDEN
jgi:hypothetical protein